MDQKHISADLFYNYFEGKTTEKDLKVLSEWLDENMHHRQLFADLKKWYIEARLKIGDNSETTELAYQKFIERVNTMTKEKLNGKNISLINPRNGYLRFVAMVIILLAVGIASYYLGHKTSSPAIPEFCEISVPYGGKSTVILPDSTVIWLNAGSKIRYNRNFVNKTRDVYLSGEAYFDVTKKKIPFIVHTSHLNIKVFGTSFNVKDYPDDRNIETTLVKGSIRVDSKELPKPILLKPNEKLVFEKKEVKTVLDSVLTKPENIAKVDNNKIVKATKKPDKEVMIDENVNIEESTSWKNGILLFNKEKLSSLTKKLERKYDIKFVFTSENLKNFSFSGTLKDFPLEQVLKAIKLTSPINYTVNEKVVTLSYNKNFKGSYSNDFKISN